MSHLLQANQTSKKLWCSTNAPPPEEKYIAVVLWSSLNEEMLTSYDKTATFANCNLTAIGYNPGSLFAPHQN